MRAGSRRGLDQATNKTTRRATTAVADAHALMLGAARAALEIAQLHRAGMGVGETIHGQRLQALGLGAGTALACASSQRRIRPPGVPPPPSRARMPLCSAPRARRLR